MLVMSQQQQCRVASCSRLAFDGHRHCCSQCRHSNGREHGFLCQARQERQQSDRSRSTNDGTRERDREPAASHCSGGSEGEQNHRGVDQLAKLRSLVESCLQDLNLEDQKKFLRDLVRAFHPDRQNNLAGGHECTVYLNSVLQRLQ